MTRWWLRGCAVMTRGLTLAIVWVAAAHGQAAGDPVGAAGCDSIVFFHREGCPHCERAHDFLDRLEEQDGAPVIQRLDVQADRAARRQFFQLSRQFDINPPGVPAFLICDRFTVGFDAAETTGRLIQDLVAGVAPLEPDRQLESLAGAGLSRLTLERLGLPLFTIAIGLIDGFNPCAMWVLAFLLSILVGVGSRSRMLLIAGTFVLVSGLMYFAFMAAWLNAFLLIGFSRALQVGLAAIALFIGAVHIKDFFAFRRGLTLSIPEGAKPTLFARARRVVNAERLAGSLISVAVLAVLVNVVEFLCTAGLPAVYTQILSARDLTPSQFYGYLALYNLAYVFDDSLMVLVAVVTLSKFKMQEHQGRWLKLIGGGVITALGLLLLLRPEWLA